MTEKVSAEELDFVKPDRALIALAVEALAAAERASLKVVTAESCTGGFIATVLSEAPGAADYFEGAFVCYTADHKCTALGLDRDLIEQHGAVSAEVARAMAESALGRSEADIAVAVTGVAGPDRDEDGNPVGLVYLAAARKGGETVVRENRFGDQGRSRIRYLAAAAALNLLAQVAGKEAASAAHA
jgi:nicotinamide-nucleotide amidase